MTRTFFALVVLGAVLLATAGAGLAVAQAGNETATPTPTETDEPSEDSIRLDGTVTITDWDYSDGAFRITFKAEHPTHVTISEATQGVEGASTFSITRERLLTGTNDVTLGVDRVGGEAQVTIVSADSIDQNRGIMLSTGQTDEDRPPVAYGTAGLLAASAAIGTGWYSFRRGRDKLEESDEPEVSRIG